jgi:hypothetical protein
MASYSDYGTNVFAISGYFSFNMAIKYSVLFKAHFIVGVIPSLYKAIALGY